MAAGPDEVVVQGQALLFKLLEVCPLVSTSSGLNLEPKQGLSLSW